MNKTSIILVSMFALLIATTAWADVEINETTFPDENFRNWVLAQSYGQDGILTEEEIAEVTTINVMSKTIMSVKGIELFTELRTLYCILAPITEIDVSNLTKLSHLECIDNQLTGLDVSKNTALRELHCQDNLLTELDVSNNKALTTLGCNSNQLTSLNLSNNTALTVLSCSYNQLTELDVSKNTDLARLVCTHNLLTSIDVSGCSALESFKCSENNLTRLDVSGCPVLDELICMSNQIKGEAMDELVENLPTKRGFLGVINHINEQNVMTKSQVAAAKAKGWYVYYNNDKNQWKNYEGSDEGTGIKTLSNSPLKGENKYDLSGRQIINSRRPIRGIYIENGKKRMIKN